ADLIAGVGKPATEIADANEIVTAGSKCTIRIRACPASGIAGTERIPNGRRSQVREAAAGRPIGACRRAAPAGPTGPRIAAERAGRHCHGAAIEYATMRGAAVTTRSGSAITACAPTRAVTNDRAISERQGAGCLIVNRATVAAGAAPCTVSKATVGTTPSSGTVPV